ncbi:MAG: hypothetical protein ACOZAJ_02315 [Patescibacteria group bacterium]
MKIWQINTLPEERPYQFLLRYLLRPIMLIFGTGKISHWWNWIDCVDPEGIENNSLLIKPDTSAPLRFKNNLKSKIKVSLGGWQTQVVIKPTKNDDWQNWRVVFKSGSGEKKLTQFCNILLKTPVRLLVGPDLVYFWGINKEGNIIDLTLLDRTKRNDKYWEKLPLV